MAEKLACSVTMELHAIEYDIKSLKHAPVNLYAKVEGIDLHIGEELIFLYIIVRDETTVYNPQVIDFIMGLG